MTNKSSGRDRAQNSKPKPALRQALPILLMLVGAYPAPAQILNGDFEDPAPAPWQMTTPRPPVPAGGIPPRRVVGAGNRFGRIGSNGTAPGIEGAAILQNFNCGDSWGSICTVTFTANFAARGNETARVYMDNGQRAAVGNIPVGQGTYMMALGGCAAQTTVAFFVESNGGDPVGIQSTLDLDDVSSECWGLIPPSGPTPIAPTEPDVRREFSPGQLPDRPASQETVPPLTALLQVGPGVTAIAYPLLRGSNTLDEILTAADGTMLVKEDPHNGGVSVTYQRSGGRWFPSGGALMPGECAFLFNHAPLQEFPLVGVTASLPSRSHPDAGEELLGNPLPRTASFEQVALCAPRVGDQVVRYQRSSPGFPPEPAAVHTFDGNLWNPPLLVPAGEAVLVRFAPTQVVEPPPVLELQPDGCDVWLIAKGHMSSDLVVQAAADFAGPWKSLVGVTLPAGLGAQANARFFRAVSQPSQGGLAGVVTDRAGAPVAGVELQLAPMGPTQVTATDGRFKFQFVPAGLVDLVAYRTVQATGADGVTAALALPSTLTVSVPAGETAMLEVDGEGQDRCHGTTDTEWGEWHTDKDGLEWREGEVWFHCQDNPKHGTDKKLGTVREEKRKDKKTGVTTTKMIEKDADGKVTKVTETVTDRTGKVTNVTTTEYTYDQKGGLIGAQQTVEDKEKKTTTTTEWKKEANGKWYKKDGNKWVEDKGPPSPPK